MKIVAFEVREDEIAPLKKLAKEANIDELVLIKERLSLENIELTKGAIGVTTLGQSKITKEVIDKLQEFGIKGYATRTIGYNHIDVSYANSVGFPVCNANYSPDGVADYTVMMILLTLRNYKPALYRINVNDYSLEGLMGRQLSSLTVGVIGTGKIGSKVIKNLSGFGCKILAYDIYQNEEVKKYASYHTLDYLYENCDIITLHTPLFDSTYHMINKDSINKMKKGVIIINCARGELMDITDVISAVEDEKIGGLGLDVFENENGIYHYNRKTEIIKNKDMAYLRQFPNVIMTQHMAFYTKEAVFEMAQCAILGLKAFSNNLNYKNKLF